MFVRLQGCNMNCSWCDTKHAIPPKKGIGMSREQIICEVEKYECNFIEFTGGEPLYQPNIHCLMKYFCDNGYDVSIETNGHYDISAIDARINIIMDIKCPGSKMIHKNNYKNIEFLKPKDEVKFVIASDEDFDFAIDLVNKHHICNKTPNIVFSPAFGSMPAERLANLVLSSGLPVRMQLQMHKFIWHPDKRGV